MHLGQRVRVYFNLHRQCLSVMDKKTRRVIAYMDEILLDDIKFVVSQAGLARVRRERRKSVIAFVEGNYRPAGGLTDHVEEDDRWQRVRFNPYEVDHFVDSASNPLDTAERVWIAGKTLYAKECRYADRHASCT